MFPLCESSVYHDFRHGNNGDIFIFVSLFNEDQLFKRRHHFGRAFSYRGANNKTQKLFSDII